MEKRKKIRGDDPNLNKLKKAKGERSLHLGDQEWFWKSDGYDVKIRSPKNRSVCLNAAIVLGASVPNFNNREVVTPYDVKVYIENNLSNLAL